MKLNKLGRFALAIAASAVPVLCSTSCTQVHTIGYLYVTGQQYNQISAYKIENTTGNLTRVATYTTNGVDPVQILITQNGRFAYVLDNGCGGANQVACPNSSTAQSNSSIELYAIGGNGVLTFQQSYASQGADTISIALSSSGAFMYALDRQAPDGSNQGDITAFTVNQDTGRLATILNQQAVDPKTGNNLPYFKVGSNPTWFSLAGSGGFLYTIEQGPGANPTAADPNQAVYTYQTNTTNGQLTLTSSSITPTGATRLTYINTGRGGTTSGNIFLLDAGPAGSNGFILPYSVGAGGALQSVVGGAVANNAQGAQAVNPSNIITESTGKWVYVANYGPNLGTGSPSSNITGYLVNAGTQLSPISSSNASTSFGTGSGPRCLLEDPSNQFIYTANFNDSTITPKLIDKGAGELNPTRGRPSFPAPGNPTWCAVSGTPF